MGFKRRNVKLTFADGPYEGLEVTCRSVSIEGLISLSDIAGMSPGDALTESDKESLRSIAKQFSELLISWNFEEEDGTPVAADVEGLASDFPMLLHLVGAYTEQIAGIPGPLDRRSTSGSQSLEGSLPMAPL